MKSFIKKHILYLFVFLIILVIVLLFLLVKFVFLKKDIIKTEVEVLVEKVGEHMFLPYGEIPSLATVTEPEKLKGQSFFENAKEGDKVLIYSKSQKAILYDPNADKIVNIAPVSLDSNLQNNNLNNSPQEF